MPRKAIKPEKYTALRNKTLTRSISYCQPPSVLFKITEADPAIRVMTDFRKIRAITTRSGTSMNDCNQHMISNNVRLLLVTDQDRGILGIITAADILGEKPLLQIQQKGLDRDDIQVRDIMTRTADLEVLTLSDVEEAKVGDIVATLIKDGRMHAIVTCGKQATDDFMICGLFSATQIGKQLGVPVTPTAIAQSFSEMEQAILA